MKTGNCANRRQARRRRVDVVLLVELLQLFRLLLAVALVLLLDRLHLRRVRLERLHRVDRLDRERDEARAGRRSSPRRSTSPTAARSCRGRSRGSTSSRSRAATGCSRVTSPIMGSRPRRATTGGSEGGASRPSGSPAARRACGSRAPRTPSSSGGTCRCSPAEAARSAAGRGGSGGSTTLADGGDHAAAFPSTSSTRSSSHSWPFASAASGRPWRTIRT